ncbi:RMD1 family protein [Methylomarinum sp. Ch1-1]|uniref:RMD1 family protein n=1 Tax=Methylomarinum roseum TaxID=3067653 RepID=A0AAU7NUY2_9GAMM|nr:RMD1 family protein [Methylomarinum sp. Ch1-1]MDP4519145.1 RMD1 family protein [Methylomarinum sp. Ch1-1]
MNEPHKHCLTLCLAQNFDFSALCQHLLENKRALLFKDVLLIDHKDALSVVFPYGAVTHWNVSLDMRRKLHSELLEFAVNPLTEFQEDNFSYSLNATQNRIQHDCIYLESDDKKLLLAVSHAMAQSIKLAAFEQQAQQTINTTRHLPNSLASKGEINLSKKSLAKIRGQLFLTKSDINVNYDLLDTPDFFWEHPEYQALYTMAANYLELSQRTEVLTKKLETIHELLEMLADEQKHQHSSTLEWIIIWLIAVEIAITLLEKML